MLILAYVPICLCQFVCVFFFHNLVLCPWFSSAPLLYFIISTSLLHLYFGVECQIFLATFPTCSAPTNPNYVFSLPWSNFVWHLRFVEDFYLFLGFQGAQNKINGNKWFLVFCYAPILILFAYGKLDLIDSSIKNAFHLFFAVSCILLSSLLYSIYIFIQKSYYFITGKIS